MKLDILVTTAHPDDAEAAMGGTILKLLDQGKKVGIIDFTRGELGTRGNAETRMQEAAEADKRLGLTARVNLGFRDGFFLCDENHILKMVQVIRHFQPEIVFSNPVSDRHPDHGRANQIVKEAAFLSGLIKIETWDEQGAAQAPWRPKRIFHYIQSCQHEPDFIVDISQYWAKKCHALRAYQTQFHSEEKTCDDPETPISKNGFWDYFEARARVLGSEIGSAYAEGFIAEKALKIDNILSLA
ncbi:MAG: bacillithiol biosynthesis deacetylase BshB1 [Alphaproteobacteria bacterium]|nr:bacillithiol biosynthesis deacetylase BshB1 [Alphaproteobacteria bacterium]